MINLKNQNMEKITKENTQELFNKKSDLNLKEKGKQKRSQIGWSLIWQFCKQNGMKRCNKTYPIEDVIGFIEGLIKENANLKNANDSFAIANKLLERVIESNNNESVVFNQKLDKITDNVMNQQAIIIEQRHVIKDQEEKNTELKKLVSKLEQKNSELKMQINKTKRTIL